MRAISFIIILILNSHFITAQDYQVYTQPEVVQKLAMYRMHHLSIDLDDDVKWENVSFKSLSGQVTKGNLKGTFSFRPTTKKVGIQVFNGKKTLTTLTLIAYEPYIQAKSAHVVALYQNCGNTLIIDPVEAGIDPAKISFKAEGALLTEGNSPGLITLAPKYDATEVKLHVFEGEQELEVLTYRIKRIPHPTVVMNVDNQTVDLKQGINLSASNQKLIIKVNSEEDFGQFLPKDAQFSATECIVTLAKGLRAIRTIKGHGTFDLTSLLKGAEAGSRIVIEVNEISRKNYAGQVEIMNIRPQVFSIPIN